MAPPTEGTYKLNTDASVKINSGRGKVSGIFRYHRGDWVIGYTKVFTHVDVYQAELLAILEGLKIAITHHLTSLEINSDSATVISMITSDYPRYSNTVAECRYLMRELGTPTLRYTCREQNSVADVMERSTSVDNAPFDQLHILRVTLLYVAQAMVADKHGVAFPRRIAIVNIVNNVNTSPTLSNSVGGSTDTLQTSCINAT
ncbi:uncharacterized protein LOC124896303 [Capsicum annuum]|uniref:uncharacterized protein LOC124896303 n=1 Tax=Capsicum annuum TaxID=4072 RepID=UPI001FB10692|nr:uncharacterized protein LOC124896303 [Capsicum annuum]